MPDTLLAQEKNDPQDKESYTEAVTARQWDGQKFLKPVANVPAFRREIKGKMTFYTKPQAGNAETPKGSEITDKDGVVWIVDKVTSGTNFHINYVTKKPAEKKP